MGRGKDAASVALSFTTGAAKCAALALILISATPREVADHKATCQQCQVVLR
ncbi:hypothetical protein ACFQVD_44790 [Streptosporangium amethystogenes subsp. fukuiense]|uniref:Uncharacterized protein n=1 Tax=Streptosporangium amethystogenes subsp. fukuiense TaxID=698418 RepID=A0ABW2TEV4_9ACTN